MTLKKTILCVDDEQSLSIHKLTLETRGYRVLACHTAAEAIALAERRSVDLVLSNVELPDAGSSDLVNQIKQCAEVPVVLLSPHRRLFHVDSRAELLLRKGTFTPAELLEHIRRLLVKRRGPRRPPPSTPAGLEPQPQAS
jgi:two-component system response regulator CpxR